MGFLLFQNHADTATLSTTTSGSMLRPLTELQKKWARGLCRGPINDIGGGGCGLVIRADLGESKRVRMVGVVGLNAVTQIQGYVSLSAVSAGGSELATGTIAWNSTLGETYGQSIWYTPPASVNARYIEISLEVYGRDSGSKHVDARRLLILDGLHLSDGWDKDWSTRPVDQSTSTATPKGGIFVGEQNQYREARFSGSGMTKAEAKGSASAWALEDALREAGKRKEVVWSPRQYTDEADPDMFINTIYGRLVDWARIEHTGGDTYRCDSIVAHETPYPALS